MGGVAVGGPGTFGMWNDHIGRPVIPSAVSCGPVAEGKAAARSRGSH